MPPPKSMKRRPSTSHSSAFLALAANTGWPALMPREKALARRSRSSSVWVRLAPGMREGAFIVLDPCADGRGGRAGGGRSYASAPSSRQLLPSITGEGGDGGGIGGEEAFQGDLGEGHVD